MLSGWLCGNASLSDSVIVSDVGPRVSLLICSPGKNIYELEGHAALRIVTSQMDAVVNYGLFDFGAPNFVYRFVKGETDYKVGATETHYFLSQYAEDGREVDEYVLDMTPSESLELMRLLEENLRPENQTYRYNYVLDNCATRPLDMVEKATGKHLGFEVPDTLAESSFRDVMRRYHKDYPWYQFGIDLALGKGIDYELSPREFTFAPAQLGDMLSDAYFIDDNGMRTPFILNGKNVLVKGGDDDADPTPWAFTPLAVGLYLLIVCLIVVWHDLRCRRISRWFDSIVLGVYGLAGCVIAFLVIVSSHYATSPNYLILWLNPFCLIVPVCIYIKTCRRLVVWYEIVNFVAVSALMLVWPFIGQSGNMAFIPFVAVDLLLGARYVYIERCLRNTTIA